VHVVVRYMERPIEIQVRTALQHVWAELSEKLSDLVDPSIKYGGGRKELTEILLSISNTGAIVEGLERKLEGMKDRGRGDGEIAELVKSVLETKADLAEMLRDMIGDAHIWMDV